MTVEAFATDLSKFKIVKSHAMAEEAYPLHEVARLDGT